MSHTREPWKYQKGFLTIYSLSGGDIGISTAIAKVSSHQLEGSDSAEENARRIVACVNACKNFTTEELESVGEHFSGVLVDTKLRCAELVTERDTYRDLCAELVEAIKIGKKYLDLGAFNLAITKAEKILNPEQPK